MMATSGTLKTPPINIFKPDFYSRVFIAAMCVMPLLAIYAPRSTSLGPPVIAVVAMALYYFCYGERPRLSRKAVLWALIIPALMAASWFWSIAPDLAITRSIKALPLLLGGAALWSLGMRLDPLFAAKFRRFFPYPVIAMGLLCLVELYFNAPVFRQIHELSGSDKNFNAAHVNRSIVVFVLMSLIAFFCVMEEGGERRKNVLSGILGLIAALVLYRTGSQSAQLAFLLGGLFYFAFPYAQKNAWSVLTALIALCLFLAPWIAEMLFRHVALHADRFAFLQNGYAGQRFEIWDFIARRALEKPWLGFGVEATREMTFDTRQLYYPGNTILHPHNFALQLWIEFGLLGAFIGAVLLGDLLRFMRKLEPHKARMVLPLLIASLSVATTGYGLWQGWWLGMFCLLFAYAALLLNQKNK